MAKTKASKSDSRSAATGAINRTAALAPFAALASTLGGIPADKVHVIKGIKKQANRMTANKIESSKTKTVDGSTVAVSLLNRTFFDLTADQHRKIKITDYFDTPGQAMIKFRDLGLGHAFKCSSKPGLVWIKCGKTSAVSFRNHAVITRNTRVEAAPHKERFAIKASVQPLDLGIFVADSTIKLLNCEAGVSPAPAASSKGSPASTRKK